MARRCGPARASNAARAPATAAASSGAGPGVRRAQGAHGRQTTARCRRTDEFRVSKGSDGWGLQPRGRDKGASMDAVTIANLYYDAWRHRAGDMSGVPLAEDLAFIGPVASFEDAEGFRAMARQAGAG